MSKDLKKRGFNFVGSTICYAFMQAVGMVNDHSVECFRYAQVTKRSQEIVHRLRRPGRPRPGKRAKLAQVSATNRTAELCTPTASLYDIVKYIIDYVT